MKLIGSGMNNVFEFQAKRNQHVEGNNRTYQNWYQEMHQSECSTPLLCFEVLKKHMEVNGLFFAGNTCTNNFINSFTSQPSLAWKSPFANDTARGWGNQTKPNNMLQEFFY